MLRRICAADRIPHIATLSNYCVLCSSNFADRATAQWHLVAAVANGGCIQDFSARAPMRWEHNTTTCPLCTFEARDSK
eukprot:3838820-Pyramimonas_sp.AAC.1